MHTIFFRFDLSFDLDKYVYKQCIYYSGFCRTAAVGVPQEQKLKVQLFPLLRSAVGKTHVLRSRLVMNYTTQKLTISTLALKLSVSAIFYPW